MSVRIGNPGRLLPVVAGDDCSVCWGVDKPFGSGATPSELVIVFEGVEKGPDWEVSDGEPFNGVFHLEQSLLFPCEFFYSNVGVAEILLRFYGGSTALSFKREIDVVYFGGTFLYNCQTVFGNQLNSEFTGGTAVIRFPGVL